MPMQLTRRDPPRQMISLVPMVDVMLILLVFFMVTSTYLNLDMIPMVDVEEETEQAAPSANITGTSLLIRIGADNRTFYRGRSVSQSQLSEIIKEKLGLNPLLSVVLLPSLSATTQAFVTNMDTLTTAGATRIRVLQLDRGDP